MSESYNASVIMEQGAAKLTVKAGGVIQILTGGAIVPNSGTQASSIVGLTDNSGGTADDIIAVVTPPSALTDNTGGTASTTLAVIGATYNQAEVRNAVASLAARQAENRAALVNIQDNIADLAAKVNGLLTAVRGVGIIAP
jgi:hypothetical protein